MVEIKAGSDPEVFVTRDGKIVPCVGMIEGRKEAPQELMGLTVQEDNVMLEFNTIPASSESKMVEVMEDSLMKLNRIARLFGLNVSDKIIHDFSDEDLISEQAKTFACEPDMNAYTFAENKSCDPESITRTCGGHFHFGLDKDYNDYEIVNMVRLSDIYQTLAHLHLEPKTERRKFYGKAGSFRVKDYGFEYRTPSNFWIFNSELVRSMFRAAQDVVMLHNEGVEVRDRDVPDIVKAIDEHDVGLANKIYGGRFSKIRESCFNRVNLSREDRLHKLVSS